MYNDENEDTRPSERITGAIEGGLDSTEKDSGEPLFDLRRYIDDVKRERTEWKQTLQDRKRQYKSTLKHMTRTKQGEQDVDLSALSETERNFLLVRPNYEHICEKAKKLAILASEVSIMQEHVTHLHKRCLLRAEKKLDDLTTRIINMIE